MNCLIYHVHSTVLYVGYTTSVFSYHYAGQSDISHDMVDRCHQFLSKCELSNNYAIGYIVNRFQQNISFISFSVLL